MIVEYLGGQIDLDPADGGMFELMRDSRWEWRKVDIIRSCLKPGQTFVDAGAYNGYFTLIAAKVVGETGHVRAFEPDPRNWGVLMSNLMLNKYQQVLAPCMGLADFNGRANLHRRNHMSWSTLLPASKESISVSVARLDNITRHVHVIDMIKIDVEGAEAAVLRGATRILHQPEPLTILMDLHPELDTDPAPVEAMLKEAGFALFDIRSNNMPIDTIPPTLVELMARKF